MTAVVVGVDPGLKKGSAVAVLDRATGRVITTQIVRIERWLDQPSGLANVLGLTPTNAGSFEFDESLLVAELAQVYERTHQVEGKKPDPNDLIDLAACAGAWCEAGRTLGMQTDLVKPAIWKGGNTPKEIEAARTKARCVAEDIALVERSATRGRHLDLWDAVGIARWAWRKHRLKLNMPAGWLGNTPNGPFDP